MNTKNNDFLVTEPVGKLLFKLAIPTLTAQLINMLYNMVDKIFIGHMPGNGDLALAGLGICLPLILIVSAFSALVASGGAPRASIAMGRGERDEAERIMGSCISLLLLIALGLTAVMLLWNREILMLFGASENIIGYAVDYMNIYAMGTIFVQLTLGMNAFITAQGFTRQSMLTVLIGAVLNIILDPIFIFVLGLGVRGAAMATIISQFVSCTWVVSFLCGKKTLLSIRPAYLRMDRNIVLSCVALGIAPFIMQGSEGIISICFNSSLQKYGGDIAVGAMTVLSSTMMLAMLPLNGIAQGAQPILSYNFGALRPDRVKALFFLLLKVCLAFSSCLWLIIMLFPRGFVSIFTPDPELIAYTARAIRVYAAVIFVMGIQIACQMTFISMGNAKASAIVAIVRKFLLLLPFVYILPHFMEEKAMGVFLTEPVSDVLAISFTVILFTVQFKKALKKMEDRIAEKTK